MKGGAVTNKIEKDWDDIKIRQLLLTNNKMVEHSLLILYSRQTLDERAAHVTGHPNGMGFNKIDAGFLSSLAEWIKKSTRPDGLRLTPKQRQHARKRLMKYIKQLTVYANTRKEIEVQHALGCDNYSTEIRKAGGTFDDHHN